MLLLFCRFVGWLAGLIFFQEEKKMKFKDKNVGGRNLDMREPKEYECIYCMEKKKEREGSYRLFLEQQLSILC